MHSTSNTIQSIARVKWTEWAPVVIILVALGVVVGYGLILRSQGSESWLDLIDIGASLVLSLSLVVVYLWQNRILREQRRTMSAGYSPVVSVRDVSFDRRPASEFSAGGEENVQAVEVVAENRGNDIASDIQVQCILDTDSGRSGRLCSNDDTLLEARLTTLQLEDESTATYRGGGPALPPTMEDVATLYGHIGLNIDGNYCSIPRALDIAIDADADVIRLGFLLQYHDASGDTYSVLLGAYHLTNPDRGIEFNEVVDAANRIPRHDLDGRIDDALDRNR